ncbi:ATPase, T2SS/T4P/T4SS family [Aggregatilinea lenta]|uniref:ATPase, T2SS/T4P/T4SS family n=1 Tax=Aggregatilinea lenta TaxID=913108 RepID=UPI0013C3420E|nr:ATPase, T2SS/T4P/T4SS family [Aggregatilinea lenta]
MRRPLHINHSPDDPPGGLLPLVPGRAEGPRFSLDALRERIEWQFHDETAHRPDILIELETEDERRTLLREVMDYVLAVEGIRLLPGDKAALLDAAHRSLFTFGPLDDLLADETVTEIEIDGPAQVHVRRGAGRLEPGAVAFDDRAHLDAVLARILAAGGGTRREDVPFLELGAVLGGRMARVTVAGPPVSYEPSVTIRLHPRAPFTLASLVERGTLNDRAADLLRAILAAEHGLLVVGDVATGKTALIGALAAALPDDARVVVVERAAEIALPPAIEWLTPAPGNPEAFGKLFKSALDDGAGWLLADEVRAEDSAAVWHILTQAEAQPPCVWAFRGDPSPDRLRSALTMLIRRDQPAVEQGWIHRALAERLPFVAGLRVIDGAPRLTSIGEWALDDNDGDRLELCPIMTWQDGALRALTPPARWLDLPGDFWT